MPENAHATHILMECPLCTHEGAKDQPHGICTNGACGAIVGKFWGRVDTCSSCGEELELPVNRVLTPSVRIVENNTRYETKAVSQALRAVQREWLDRGHEPTKRMLERGIQVTLDTTTAQSYDSSVHAESVFNVEIKLRLAYGRKREDRKVVGNYPLPKIALEAGKCFAYGLFRQAGTRQPNWNECRDIATSSVYEMEVPFQGDDEEPDPLEKQRERYRHRLEKALEAAERIEHYQSVIKKNRTILRNWRKKALYYQDKYPEMATEVREEYNLPDAKEIDIP